MTREARASVRPGAGAQQHGGRGRREGNTKDGTTASSGPKKGASPFLAPPMAPAKPRPVVQPQPPAVRKEPVLPALPSRTTSIYTAKPRPVTGRNHVTAAPDKTVVDAPDTAAAQRAAEEGLAVQQSTHAESPASAGVQVPPAAQHEQQDTLAPSRTAEVTEKVTQSLPPIITKTPTLADQDSGLSPSSKHGSPQGSASAIATSSPKAPSSLPSIHSKSPLSRPHVASGSPSNSSTSPAARPSPGSARSPAAAHPHPGESSRASPTRHQAHGAVGGSGAEPAATHTKGRGQQLSNLGPGDKSGQTGASAKADPLPPKKPSLALPDRAVHLYFLQQLEAMEVEVPDDEDPSPKAAASAASTVPAPAASDGPAAAARTETATAWAELAQTSTAAVGVDGQAAAADNVVPRGPSAETAQASGSMGVGPASAAGRRASDVLHAESAGVVGGEGNGGSVGRVAAAGGMHASAQAAAASLGPGVAAAEVQSSSGGSPGAAGGHASAVASQADAGAGLGADAAAAQPRRMKTVRLGSLKTADVVRKYIRQATQPANCSLAEAVECGALSIPGDWCTPDGRFTDDRMTQGQAGKPVFGRVTYYVVHSWTYRFKDLVSLLEQHYNSLPADTGWLDVYYYLDVFAVNQNLDGPLTARPQCDMTGVMQAAKAVLFTIHPLLRPATPKRLWCLYEALTAARIPGLAFELLVDDSGGSKDKPAGFEPPRSFADAYIELIERFKAKVVARLDIATAEARGDADRAAIMAQLAKMSSEAEANAQLQQLLLTRMMDALLRHALRNADVQGVQVLMQAGAGLHGNTIQLTGLRHNGDEVVQLLGQVLMTNTSVSSLYIRRSGVKAAGAKAIAAALGKHTALTNLDLAENMEVKDDGVLAIAEALPFCPGPAALTRLALKKTNMTDKAAEALGRLLAGTVPAGGDAAAPPKPCVIMDLDVSFNAGITPPGLQALARGVGASSAVSRLDVSRIPSLGAAARAVGESLSYCHTLTSLFASGCKLTTQQLSDLANGLSRCAALKHLDLQENMLGDAGLTLATLLKGCKNLHCLRLDGNSQLASKATMAQLAAALPDASALRILGLQGTGMTPDSSKVLAAGLPKSGLQDLDLGGNCDMGDAGAHHVLAAVQGHRSLLKLNLSSCSLTAGSSHSLLALLSSAPAVGPGVRAAGARAGAGAGRATAGLEELVLEGNHELPDSVLEKVAVWRARRWGQRKAALNAAVPVQA